LAALAFVTAVGVLAGVSVLRGDELTLVGIFASKNYFGLCVALLLLLAMIVAFDRSQPGPIRLIAFAAAALDTVFLVQSRSTGALVCSVAALAITYVLTFIVRFPPRVRFGALPFVALIAVVFLIVLAYFVDVTELLYSLGKDVTLTGRTWLWEWAFRAIEDNPALGVGYQAFWQPGNWGAEEIWFHDQKPDKTGYHFHNTFLQVAVDLGFVGLVVLLATIVAIFARIGSCLLFSRPDTEQTFAIAAFLFLLFRFPIEVDLFWQFQIPTIVLSLIWIYLGLPRRRRSYPDLPLGPPSSLVSEMHVKTRVRPSHEVTVSG
jgi:exopolysaccharide production protein ExoQ